MKVPLAFCLSAGAAILATAQEPNAPAETAPNKVVKIIPSDGTRIKLGGAVAAVKITKKVNPVYPPLARQTRIQGTVRLHVILSKDGSVQQFEVISGHPLLVQSAMDAVRQWKYQPTLLNGEPVEVDTTIDVIYSLGDNASSNMAGRGQTTKIDAKLHDDIKHLLEVNHAKERGKQVGGQMLDSLRPILLRSLPKTPNREKIVDSYAEKLMALFQTDEMEEGMITTYAKYFDDDDIVELTKFYETPLGQKFSDKLPGLSTDLMQLGQTIARENIPGILKEICKEYPELAGQVPDCPAQDVDKKSQLLPSQAGSVASGPGNK